MGTVVQLNQAQNQYTNHATKGFKQVGDLLSKIPGLSGISGVFKDAENGSTVFARLGAAVTIAATAYAAYDMILKANIDRAEKMIAVQSKMYDMTKKTMELEDNQAKKGAGQFTQTYRRAFGIGGQDAIDNAAMLEGTGNISHEESLYTSGESGTTDTFGVTMMVFQETVSCLIPPSSAT